MSETQWNEPNLKYGFIPENIYQNLKYHDFSIRLDAAQILDKSVTALPPSSICELSKDNVISFFEFAKQFLTDENFGVINCFSEILDYLFDHIDKSILRENLNTIYDMLIPPLQDKRYAVRNISSNLVIKYTTILKSEQLLDRFISIFYDQPVSSQIEILNIIGRFLSISDIDINTDNFNLKLANLIENSFLIVNSNVRSAAVKLLKQISQSNPELYKSIPDELKKVTEVEDNSKRMTSRLLRTPTSALPPIYMSLNSNSLKQKIAADQQQTPKAPDTASSKKRTDEFWYRSKPRFAKTAGFIIGKSGKITLQPNMQQCASTNFIPKFSSNHFVRTPDAVFQPHEPYSPLVTDEGCFYSNSNQDEEVHLYDQICENIEQFDQKMENINDNNYIKEEESEEENIDTGNKETRYEYKRIDSDELDLNDNDEKNSDDEQLDDNIAESKNSSNYYFNLNSQKLISSNKNDDTDDFNTMNNTNAKDADEIERSTDFDEFDSMPAPRVIASNKKKSNRASLINMNEQTDLGADVRSFFDNVSSPVKEPHIASEEQDSVDNFNLNRPFQRLKRQFKPRPPSLPPTSSPSLFYSKGPEANSTNDDFSSESPNQDVLNIRKLKYQPGGASFRTKRVTSNLKIGASPPQPKSKGLPPKSSKGSLNSPPKEKPNLQSILADLQSTSDWEKQNSALLRVQLFITSSPNFVLSNVRVLSFEIVPLCSSIRSALSKTALECLTSIASSFGSEMTPFFESIVNDLLTILLSSRGFITKLASGCISTILRTVSRKKAVEYLIGDHKKRPGSCKATLASCLEELASDEESDIEAFVSAEMMKAIALFITDANPDARKHARGALKKIASRNPDLASDVSSMRIEETEKKVIIEAIGK